MEPQRVKTRRVPLRAASLVAAGVLALFLGAGGTGLWTFLSGLRANGLGYRVAADPAADERINVLVLGIDAEGDDIHRSDTMMVVSIDPLTRRIGVLSIPRDTLVAIPGRRQREKIAHAHAHGGPSRAMEAVRDFLGEPVHYYVRVDFRGFKALVDALGGVTIDVEKPMRYVDPYQNLNINLGKGVQRLDGDKALQYVRYRQDGDIPRIRRQQKFLRALADQAWSLGAAPRLPRLVRELSRYVDTDMSPETVLRIARLAAAAGREGIEMGAVATEPVRTRRGDYLGEEADRGDLAAKVDRLVRGIDREANRRVAVRVIDSTGTPGAAERVAETLERQGYRLAGVSDAARQDFPHTSVIYQEEAMRDTAELLARSLRREAGAAALYRGGRAEWFAPAEGGTGLPADVVVTAGHDIAPPRATTHQ